MKILNDLFSLISGTGKKDNLQDMVEDSPIRVLVALLAVLILFLGSVSFIVFLILSKFKSTVLNSAAPTGINSMSSLSRRIPGLGT